MQSNPIESLGITFANADSLGLTGNLLIAMFSKSVLEAFVSEAFEDYNTSRELSDFNSTSDAFEYLVDHANSMHY